MMLRRASSTSSEKSNASRRSNSAGFDEFGFALTKKRERKLLHRSHDYSYPQSNPVKVKELCEFLSYWNGSSFICRTQMEKFIRIGIPPAIRGRVWKCLLNIDSVKSHCLFDYEACQAEIRKPLVDLGVSEYSIIASIDSLVDTENEISSGQASVLASTDLTLFKTIAMDLCRSFPTHRTLMGDRPEAIEGQAKLFRVLSACARYNPQLGYVQGMSYIAAVLLMVLSEEEAFWALVALLEKTKHLSELFDSSLKKIQHQALVFQQLLKHRRPRLFQHLETLGVSPLHFVTPWFLTLFTSLPCWDSVLAVWDLVLLHGLQAVFRTGLTILLLLETRIMGMSDEGTVLPLLLRVPVDVSRHCVLMPALWNTDLQEWEVECMNKLVLEEADGGHDEEKPDEFKKDPDGGSVSVDEHEKPENKSEKEAPGSSAKTVFSRLLRVAQNFLLETDKHSGAAKPSSVKKSKSPALSRLHKTRISTFGKAQVRARRNSGGRPFHDSTLGGVRKERLRCQDAGGGLTKDSTPVWRTRSDLVGKVARRKLPGHSEGGRSLQLKDHGCASQRPHVMTARPRETTSRPMAVPSPPGEDQNHVTCPVTASQVRESQLI